ncbi:MAG: DUF6886 family protein [Caulobacterales bacterium]
MTVAEEGVRLFHFSEDTSIEVFAPRPVRVPAERAPGQGWLNGPLVWAIDEPRQPMYLFPRDCPRILLWPTERTTPEDLQRWFGGFSGRMVAHIEEAWRERHRRARVFRYELPATSFQSLSDAGMWVSRQAVEPLSVEALDDLPGRLAGADVDLRILPDLLPLKGVWETSLHASGIRLRNAQGWDPPLGAVLERRD